MRLILLVASLLAGAHPLTGSAQSSTYSRVTDACDAGGGRSEARLYSLDGALNAFSGVSDAGEVGLRSGFAGQLYEPVALRLDCNPNPVNEGSSTQLRARLLHDDGTWQVVNAASLNLSVSGGLPASVSNSGVISVGIVAAHTNFCVFAAYLGFQSFLSVPVLDTNRDNFGAYAQDGLPDDWQVRYFGWNASLASPAADFDGDGLSNLAEFRQGTSPVTADTDADGVPDGADSFPTTPGAIIPSSANYTLAAGSLDAAGGIANSRDRFLIASLEAIGGISGSPSGEIEHGFIPQLEDDFARYGKATRAASAIAASQSLILQPFAGFIQGNLNTNFVTTFDGRPTPPSAIPYNGELRPRAGAPGVYEADFVVFDSAGSLWQYGSMVVNVPTTDDDQNSIPDLLQWDQPGTTPVSGQSLIDYPAIPTGSIQGQLARSAGSLSGTFSLAVNNAGGSVSYSGTYQLPFCECLVYYARGLTNQLEVAQVRFATGSATNFLRGECTFSVSDPDHLSLAPFTLVGKDQSTYSVQGTTLVRRGNKYVGQWKFADGDPHTAWPDFTTWVVELTDGNDLNANGIPDLSDSLDTDGDGLPDEFELAYGLNPTLNDAQQDRDGDGMSNLKEYLAGTDPGNATSVLKLKAPRFSDGTIILEWPSVTGKRYQVEFCPELHSNPAWQPLGEGLSGTGATLILNHVSPLTHSGFYRVRVLP